MLEEILLISCPGADGGLFITNGVMCSRISSRPVTGLYVSVGQMLYAYQDNGGSSVRALIEGVANEKLLSEESMDLHDLLCSNGKVYAAATEQNCVIIFDEDYNRLDSWCIAGDNDSVHLNSIAIYHDRLLASIFGRFSRNREYKEGTINRGEVVDIKTGDTFICGLSQPHTLKVVGEFLYICNSEGQEVRVYRGAELIRKIALPGYARGLVVGKHSIYVGISKSRNIDNGGVGSAFIAVLDRESMGLAHVINIPASEIYDICIVDSCAATILPHISNDLIDEMAKLEKSVSDYKRGYESYKLGYESYKRGHESYKLLSLSMLEGFGELRDALSVGNVTEVSSRLSQMIAMYEKHLGSDSAILK